MKNLILASVLFVSAAAVAQKAEPTKLPEGSISLSSITADTINPTELCPKDMTCIANGTILNLNFIGGGCLDELLPLTYEVNGNEILVHAQLAHNKKSLKAMCMAIPTHQAEITLINQYPPFTVRFLGTGQTVVVK